MRIVGATLLLLASLLSAQTRLPSPAPPSSASRMGDRLPVKKVVLYKNGVGYFEHTGKVQDVQQVNIDFTTAQLDDVIKSLTVLDLGEGRISGIRYNSIAPLEERLRTLRLSLGEQTNHFGFLQSLRGAQLEVRNGAQSSVGRLLSVETRSRVKNDLRSEVIEVSLVSDAGEVRTFEVTPATGIRIAENDLHEEVNRYLGLIGSARERDVRRMTIAAEGKGERSLFVSYISEVPVWKSTYRIVLPADPKQKALLQGWAIVDNTVGEDWTNIELSLVAGAPQSFVQHISQPQYARRPVVGLPETAQLAPQSHESTMNSALPSMASAIGGVQSLSVNGRNFLDFVNRNDLASGNSNLTGIVRDPSGAVVPNVQVTLVGPSGARTVTSDYSGRYTFSSVPAGNYTLVANANGFSRLMNSNLYVGPYATRNEDLSLSLGAEAMTVEVSAEAEPIQASTSELLEQLDSEATGQEIGDLFEYKLKQRVTIGKNQSALVPIVQAHIDADRVSLWNAQRGRALRAIWVNNTSGLSLDAGTFNVLDHDTFAGEGLLEIIRPGERRLLSYAVDQSVKVKSEERSANEKVTRVRILGGIMTSTFGTRSTRNYTVRNNDDVARNVVVEHAARDGWKLISPQQPEETTSSFLRFRVAVEPHQAVELLVDEFRPKESVFQLYNVTDDTIAFLLKQKSIDGQIEQELRKVAQQKMKVLTLDQRVRDRQKEMSDISADQQRLRENMKALRGSAEEKALLQRYASQLNTQEDRMEAIRKEIASLQAERVLADQELLKIIGAITLDVAL